jgi:hypothetical protein
MDNPQPVESPSLHAHNRQLAWQILIPFCAAAVVIIAAGVLVVTRGSSSPRTWADISIIWLIAPTLVFALIFVAVLGFMIYALARLMKVTPRYTGKVQGLFATLSGWIHTAADGAAKPIVWSHQAGAIIKSIFKL